MRKRAILMGVLSLLGVVGVRAQTAVASGGGEAGGNGTVSYTVGQTVVGVIGSDEGSVAAGVQQAYAIIVKDGIGETRISVDADVYPNPTTDRLHIRVRDMETTKMSYELLDKGGKVLKRGRIEGYLTDVEMSGIQADVYLLKVSDRRRALKTFKVIKK